MKGKRLIWLTGAFIGLLLGADVGADHGQVQFERAWQRVQTDSRSVQGDAGSYLCLMGDAPLYWGMFGALIGLSAGASAGLVGLTLRRIRF